MAAEVLLRLAILTGNQEYARRATATLRSLSVVMARTPLGFGQWLCALDFYLSTPKEIAVVGPWDHPGTQALLDQVYGPYLPNKVVTGYDPSRPEGAEDMPLLEGRYMVHGKPSAYVCQNYACLTPATEAGALAEQLDAG